VALIPPFFLDCVVAIGFDSPQGINWGATGFLYASFQKQLDENRKEYMIWLVTNKHVLLGQKKIWLRFNPQ
jgi:hypothetical protein